MLRNAFWLVLCAGALTAIAAGFVQASFTTHPPPLAQVRRAPPPLPPRAAPAAAVNAAGAAPADEFTADDVVVERTRSDHSQWQPERLMLVVGLCGRAIAVESGFLRLSFPVAFVVDPNAAQAPKFAELVRSAGQTLLVQVTAPPSAAALTALHARLGAFDGVAAHDAAGMLPALRGTGLTFFDERGDSANAATFAAAQVALVQRDVTADDRASPGYVRFMLARAASLSRRVGPVAVFVRPLPSSLAAVRAFAGERAVQMVALRP